MNSEDFNPDNYEFLAIYIPYDYGLIFIRCKPFAIPFVHPNPTTLGIVRLRNSYEDEDFIILPDHHFIRPFSALLTYTPEEVFPN